MPPLSEILSACSPVVQGIFAVPEFSGAADPFAAVRAATIGLESPGRFPDEAVVRRAWGRLDLLPPHLAGARQPRIYLDSGASTLSNRWVEDTRAQALPYYANSHTKTNEGGRVMTEALEAVHEMVLRFVHADPATHTVVFLGSGATEGINRAAEILEKEGARKRIFGTEMEHHANHLPWLKRFPHHYIAVPVDPSTGRLQVEVLEGWLRECRGLTRLVTVTGVSNVTGFLNDLRRISGLAHEAGAELFVDAAQMVAHRPIDMQALGIDWLAFSSHKMYAPGGPGVLVLPKKDAARMVKFGGGMVLSVNKDHFFPTRELPDLQEPGTPNILGVLQMGSALMMLDAIGMERVQTHEEDLMGLLMDGLAGLEGAVTVYGSSDLSADPRAGVVSLNLSDVAYNALGLGLDHFFRIAVRTGCFCAHPYVKALLGVTPEMNARVERELLAGRPILLPGMVRASLGVYSSEDDVRRFLAALRLIVEDADFRKNIASRLEAEKPCASSS